MDVILGTILPWSIPFAPAGWHFCDGSIMQIQQYAALYSLIGIQYGGNGTTTFALPDLRGRSPIGTNYTSGPIIERGTAIGSYNQNIILSEENLPTHTHGLTAKSVLIDERTVTSSLYGTSDDGNHDVPQNGDYLGAGTAVGGRYSNLYRGTLDAPTALSGVSGSIGETVNESTGTLGNAGGDQAVTVSRVQPSMVINYIIALQGYYPQRP